MIKFGLSSYLKLVSSNPRPRRTQLKKRLEPTSDGRDYHAQMRFRAQKLLVKGGSVEDFLASLSRISDPGKRSSVQAAITTLLNWRSARDLKVFEAPKFMYSSPNEIFKIDFSPDFGTLIDGKLCAVHLWNTKTVKLSEREVNATLSLLKESYTDFDNIVVLSLIDENLMWSNNDPSSIALGKTLALSVENTILELEEELRTPSKGRPTPSGGPLSPVAEPKTRS